MTLEASIKIMVLTPVNVARRWAGDWVQAIKTTEALGRLGCEVRHSAYRTAAADAQAETEVRLEIIGPGDVPPEVEVLHFIPGRLTAAQGAAWRGSGGRRILAGSSIFWESRTHRRVIMANAPERGLRQWLSYANVYGGKRKYDYLEAFDLVLPNSQAEVANCREHHRLRPGALVAGVPNGLDALPSACDPIQAHYPELTERGYIIYPGVFAARKNQLGFIRAMRGQDYPVVFMGGPLDDRAGRAYYERCVKEADPRWLFTGAVPHASPQFYALMANARVVCLASSCETPGIAALEAAALGARPAVTCEGAAPEYLGFEGEYFDPSSATEILSGVQRAWERGPLGERERQQIAGFTWDYTARLTLFYYQMALRRDGWTT